MSKHPAFDIAAIHAEKIEGLSMIDKIHLCERLGVIKTAELWKDMRDARNHVAHEYPDEPSVTAQYLTRLHKLSSDLLGIYRALC
jgi:hypothetical protein